MQNLGCSSLDNQKGLKGLASRVPHQLPRLRKSSLRSSKDLSELRPATENREPVEQRTRLGWLNIRVNHPRRFLRWNTRPLTLGLAHVRNRLILSLHQTSKVKGTVR